ncbi:cache domain-containing protein [Pseudobutyrivibrio xylanivorans]|uniref:Methyl-accepting chemotaxis protein n=1 Tax=Pseudobutyrivibrio xylanivorans TaxID=185007 RepID=A0A5P6VUQ3_PSEXY|nr:cache domain-containing protein [Pseudobutyrivibrio xylanivorans]QFJ54974.1 methyl-accepting chemotaxis protein [Pseudobutyrivibrio xylanivorans]
MGFNSWNSIRHKVSRRVVVALLVTVFALSVVNLIYMTRRVQNEQEVELNLVAYVSAHQIDEWVVELEGVTNGIADSLSGMESLDEQVIRKIINKVAERRPDLYFVYVGTEEGNMYMARGVRFAEGVDVRERGWYKQAKAAGHTIVTDPYVSATRNDVMMATVSTPIYFGSKMVGVVGVDADVSTIGEVVKELDFKDGAYGFLTDSAGNIVAHKNDEYNPTVNGLTNIVETIPEIKKIIDAPGSSLVSAPDYTGSTMIYSTARLDACNWVVGVAYPAKVVARIVDRGIRICLFTAFICIFLAAGDMTVAIKKILLPIDNINPVLDRLMVGDLSKGIAITDQDDELGLLQQKMSLLVRRLQEIIGEQKYVLGEMEKGNLVVEDIEQLPGDLAEISNSVNSIKATFNDIIADIQFSAINLQSFAMGADETTDIEQMRMLFEELSAEANALMEKTSKFITK